MDGLEEYDEDLMVDEEEEEEDFDNFEEEYEKR